MLVPLKRINRLIGDVRAEWRRMARNLAPEATRSMVSAGCRPARQLWPSAACRQQPGGAQMARSGLREDHGVKAAAVNRPGMNLATPGGDLVLQADDVQFVIGPQWEPFLR